MNQTSGPSARLGVWHRNRIARHIDGNSVKPGNGGTVRVLAALSLAVGSFRIRRRIRRRPTMVRGYWPSRRPTIGVYRIFTGSLTAWYGRFLGLSSFSGSFFGRSRFLPGFHLLIGSFVDCHRSNHGISLIKSFSGLAEFDWGWALWRWLVGTFFLVFHSQGMPSVTVFFCFKNLIAVVLGSF